MIAPRARGYWTKETVQQELIHRYNEGKGMKPIDILTDDNGLYQAVKRIYGDWIALYDSLNIQADVRDRRPRGYWSQETVTHELQDWARQGHQLNAGAVAIENQNLYQGALDQYGSWSAALQASGFSAEEIAVNRDPGTWTKAYVISEIQRLEKGGESLTPSDIDRNYGSLYTYGLKLFGGWDKALEASGCDVDSIYTVRRPHGYWTKEGIIEYLADRHKKGYSISAGIINGAGFGSLYREAIKYYGSWSVIRREVKQYIREQDEGGFDTND